jgi:hypothetical protein
VLFFIAAMAHGVLEVHSSTDTWIGLAAGRQIMSSPQFPVKDTFSYTFYGQTWFNQNWLTHVYLWVLYRYLGHDAVIYGTWAIAGSIFVFVGLAVRFRTGSWLAAGVAGAIVGVACRDWLSARPSTVQFFLMSACWMALMALASQGPRRRWWPIALLLVLFIVWPHAHGSFVFGCGLVALYMGCTVVGRLLIRWTTAAAPPQACRLDWLQLGLLAFVVVYTVVFGALLSPFGWDNYFHFLKVAESPVFREVGEWHRPWDYSRFYFPGPTRFWLAFGLTWLAVLTALALRVLALGPLAPVVPSPASGRDRQRHRHAAPARGQAVRWDLIFLDVASVVLGLSMALFARRFAPVFYILAAPAITARVCTWGSAVGRGAAQNVARMVGVLCWAAAVVVGYVTFTRAAAELAVPASVGGQHDLLDRVTKFYENPASIMEFLGRNELKPNLLTEWTVGGVVMFHVPGARVYMDGRSQQVYSELHYRRFQAVISGVPSLLEEFDPGGRGDISQVLIDAQTDAVMVKLGPESYLPATLPKSGKWRVVLVSMISELLVRTDSPLMAEIVRREREGVLWWPDDAQALVSRGWIWLNSEPPDPERAMSFFQAGVARDLMAGLSAGELWRLRATFQGVDPAVTARLVGADGSGGWAGMTKAWLLRGRPAEGLARLEQERRSVEQIRFDAYTEQQINESIAACERRLRSELPPRP